MPPSSEARVDTGEVVSWSATSARSTWDRLVGMRMVDLNAAGWAAVLAPGAVTGLALTWRRPRLRPLGVLGGMAAAVAVARVVDERRWRASTVRRELDLDEAQVVATARAMQADGLPVHVFEDRYDLPDGLVVLRRGIAHPAAAQARVERWLDEHRVDEPRP